jgi:hypothetical protein
MRSAPAALSLIAAAFALAACASSETAFLADPPAFRPTDSDPGASVWFEPEADFTEYDRLVIDPTEVALVSGADAGSLEPAVLRSLAGEFRDTLVRVVDPYYSVLAEPAPRTLRLRTALTDVTLTPGGGTAADVTSSRIEWEMLDAQTGRRLGAGYRKRDAEPGTNGFEVWADKLLDFMNRRADVPR